MHKSGTTYITDSIFPSLLRRTCINNKMSFEMIIFRMLTTALLVITAITSIAHAQSTEPSELRLHSGKSGVQAKQIAGPEIVVTSQTRVVPKHVYQSQKSAAEITAIPSGYKPVWGEERLNPKRAHQTLSGVEQSNRILSRTVPRAAPSEQTRNQITRRDR
ncbi:hypothetical protein [Roseovarius sp. EL26]|uniref:hypothetical protein n=1 Tax=Roseovarius sp. EL26 TaxID=2126672 RepID=UPI000EA03B24|nr:hypothetical protein [Roseovarius sp. EL26]